VSDANGETARCSLKYRLASAEFDAAIGPWLIDLQRQSPDLLGGPAYLSVTSVLGDEIVEESAVPIGFDSDMAYLGGARRRLAQTVMAGGKR
jgi:hypothetical protein